MWIIELVLLYYSVESKSIWRELHILKKSRHLNIKCIRISDSWDSFKPSSVLSSYFNDLNIGSPKFKEGRRPDENLTAGIMVYVMALYASVNWDNDKGKVASTMIRLSTKSGKNIGEKGSVNDKEIRYQHILQSL